MVLFLASSLACWEDLPVTCRGQGGRDSWGQEMSPGLLLPQLAVQLVELVASWLRCWDSFYSNPCTQSSGSLPHPTLSVHQPFPGSFSSVFSSWCPFEATRSKTTQVLSLSSGLPVAGGSPWTSLPLLLSGGRQPGVSGRLLPLGARALWWKLPLDYGPQDPVTCSE